MPPSERAAHITVAFPSEREAHITVVLPSGREAHITVVLPSEREAHITVVLRAEAHIPSERDAPRGGGAPPEPFLILNFFNFVNPLTFLTLFDFI